jgi:2-methylisocitrate lyase-like PEP mutase family enzyme
LSIRPASLSPGKRLRTLITDLEILVLPGVFDGFSTRLAEAGGFKAAFITGAGVSESRFGWPDVGLMGLAENLDACRALSRSTFLPLLGDGDTGYGNAVNVFVAVRQFEQTGLAGVMLEDQAWPKRCGHMAGKELISAEEMVEKIRAAVESRRDKDFVIEARTDAAGPYGLGEAIRRGNLYAEAGADILFADALLTEADIAQFSHEVPKPVLVNMGFGIRGRATTPLLSASRLHELGVACVIYPRLLTSAAVMGMRKAVEVLLQSIADGISADRPDLCVSFEELNELMGLNAIQEIETRFSTPDQLNRKYGDTARPESIPDLQTHSTS